jgi:hypothetical protein
MLRFALAATVLTSLAASEVRAQSSPVASGATATTQSATDVLLDRLVGDWHMVGHVRGKPVTYTLAARRVLGDRYVELHMTDVNRPAQYEARVFVGADTVPGKVLVHWLDSFGAAFSVPHGSGSVKGDTLRFEFPYGTRPFRNTFVYSSASRSWMFRLEPGDGHGGWRLFAEYDVRPAAAAPPAR